MPVIWDAYNGQRNIVNHVSVIDEYCAFDLAMYF